LIIDDELHIRQFLRAAFEFEGFTVQEPHDAEEGIRSATLKPPDLIILDLGLPDRDGSSIIERLRAWSKTPIIVLTVRSSEREKVRLLELGADDLVLEILAQHAGKVVTRQQLMKQVWGGPHLDDTHYLRIIVRKLRKKIEVDPTRPRFLLTELGIGYRLVQ